MAVRMKVSDLPPEMREAAERQLKAGFKRHAKFRTKKPGVMNKTEEAFAEVLERRRLSGEIAGWWYESITLKLAQDCRYSPDFFVVSIDGTATFFEVKAWWKKGDSFIGDAKPKLRIAADLFWPFKFMVSKGRQIPKKDGGGWEWHEETMP